MIKFFSIADFTSWLDTLDSDSYDKHEVLAAQKRIKDNIRHMSDLKNQAKSSSDTARAKLLYDIDLLRKENLYEKETIGLAAKDYFKGNPKKVRTSAPPLPEVPLPMSSKAPTTSYKGRKFNRRNLAIGGSLIAGGAGLYLANKLRLRESNELDS